MHQRRSAVLLDKDGTLVDNVPYNVDPARIRLAAGAAEALPRLHEAGYALVVVSNQAGIARGIVTAREVEDAAAALGERVAAAGAKLSGFYYCPHDPVGAVAAFRRACDCRKPASGLLARAAAELALDLGRSWLVGDILDDIEAGRRAGCRTVLIDNGNETVWQLNPVRLPHHVVDRLDAAADIILALDARRNGHGRVALPADATATVTATAAG